MQSLVLFDVFNSLLSAQKPFLENIRLSTRPDSYHSLYTNAPLNQAIANCLEPEVLEILEDVRFALFFRAPSCQSRRLSSEESIYLFRLLEKISYGLCSQQSRLVGHQTISEIAVYGMIVVKEEIFLDIIQHSIMPITILRRLASAISAFGTSLQGSQLTIALWASTVALAGLELDTNRGWALQFLNMTLTRRHGRSWSSDWTDRLRDELQLVLWHQKIEAAFLTICDKVHDLHCQNLGPILRAF